MLQHSIIYSKQRLQDGERKFCILSQRLSGRVSFRREQVYGNSLCTRSYVWPRSDLNLYFFGRGIHNSGPYEYILYDSMIQHRPAEAIMIQNSVDQIVDPVQNPASKFPPVRHASPPPFPNNCLPFPNVYYHAYTHGNPYPSTYIPSLGPSSYTYIGKHTYIDTTWLTMYLAS